MAEGWAGVLKATSGSNKMKMFERSRQNDVDKNGEKLDQVQPNEASETAMFGVGRAWHRYDKAKRDEEIQANNEFLVGRYAIERDEVLKNPEYVGASLDGVIFGGHMIYVEKYLETGDNSVLPERFRRFSSDAIESEINSQLTKEVKFKQYIDSFNGNLRMVRINKVPKFSPMSLEFAIQSNGAIDISEEFVKQLQYLQNAGVDDITVVASTYYDRHGRETNGYLVGQDRDDYFKMVEALVDKVGTNLTIEIGNETNEDIIVGNNTLIAKYVDPVKYAEFYNDVANRLKDEYPGLRLAIAGTSSSDPDYLMAVLKNINNHDLVDVISTHPYRGTINGVSSTRHDSKKTKYIDEEDRLVELANQYGAEYRVGEITYGGDDDDAYHKLSLDLRRAAAKGIKSNIWPREGLPF